jgi:2-methylcitrate dehydratase
VVTLKSGEVITDELAVADAHPQGARPFARKQYEGKFTDLAAPVIDSAEQDRFLATVADVAELPAGRLGELNILVRPEVLATAPVIPNGIF